MVGVLIGASRSCWADSLARVVRLEQEIKDRDYALELLADELGAWLGGRSTHSHMRAFLKKARVTLAKASSLPGVARKVSAAENGIVAAISKFVEDKAPDIDGQRELFRSLNKLSYERSLALLDWRTESNRSLLGSSSGQARLQYLRWEASWIIVWRAEAEASFRLQEACLSSVSLESGALDEYIRQILALQGRAELIGAAGATKELQSLALSHVVSLARTAEQLARLSRNGGTSGTVVRLSRLNKEQTGLVRRLQELRIGTLTVLAKAAN